MAYIRIVTHGTEQWKQYLRSAAAKAAKPAPFLKHVIIPDMERVEEAMFQSQGRRGGGSWKFLADETIRTKAQKRQDPRINIATFAMIQSLVDPEDENAIRKVYAGRLTFGSTAPGIEQSQRFRPVIRFTKYDRARWARLWARYIVEGL